MKKLFSALFIPITVLLACAKAEYNPPELGGIYTQAAMRSHLDSNPVILIPGIPGTKLMDERVGDYRTPNLVSPIKWSNVTFLFTDHLGLTKSPAFSDNVLFILLEEPRS